MQIVGRAKMKTKRKIEEGRAKLETGQDRAAVNLGEG